MPAPSTAQAQLALQGFLDRRPVDRLLLTAELVEQAALLGNLGFQRCAAAFEFGHAVTRAALGGTRLLGSAFGQAQAFAATGECHVALVTCMTRGVAMDGFIVLA